MGGPDADAGAGAVSGGDLQPLGIGAIKPAAIDDGGNARAQCQLGGPQPRGSFFIAHKCGGNADEERTLKHGERGLWWIGPQGPDAGPGILANPH